MRLDTRETSAGGSWTSSCCGSRGAKAIRCEPVTIRSYLKRRWTATFVSGMTIMFAVGIARTHLPTHIAWVALALGIAGVALLIRNLSRTPCPNCSRPMGSTAVWINRGTIDRINQCATCGISLDKQMPGRS
jgi:hypothetical protein